MPVCPVHTVGITYRPTTSAKYLTAILMVFCEFVSLFFRLLSPLTLFFRYYYSLLLRSPVHVFKDRTLKHSVECLCRGTRVAIAFVCACAAKLRLFFGISSIFALHLRFLNTF